MEVILHRRNTIQELMTTSTKYGAEIDLRAFKNRIIVQHDPFIKGEDFEKWIKFYKHGTLILNIKEEGIEFEVINILRKNNIENFFLLDQSFPYLLKLIKSGEYRTALRISKFESINNAFNLKLKAKWIWMDYFERFYYEKEDVQKLKSYGYQICLVSPELLGYKKKETIRISKKIINQDYLIDAVCTKFPDLWSVYE